MPYPIKGECRNTGRTWFIKGQRSAFKGRKMSVESKKRLSESHKGQIPWNKGKSGIYSKETIIKMSKAKKEKKNFNWNGGTTELNRRIRNLPKFREWRIDIYKKYNSTCNRCGIHSHQICQAHHIRPLSEIINEFLSLNPTLCPKKDKDKLSDLAINHEPFWDIENGEVLCKECHADVD